MYKVFFNRMIHTSKSNLLRGPGKRANPGSAHQLRAVESTEEMTHDFADMESDFMNVHGSHKQHELESQILRDRTRLAVVKGKYFKEKFPNFLMYAEKEQIKLLHQRDHEEWNVEKLVESFPTSADIVRKIVRSNWKSRSKKRVLQHDESVCKNWELLRKDSFSDLPSAFREHLKKFLNRRNNELFQKVQNKSFQSTLELPKPKNQEFVSIVTGEKYQDNQSKEDSLAILKFNKNSLPQHLPISNNGDTYLIDRIQDKRSMRLQELKKLKFNSNNLSTYNNITSPEDRAHSDFSNPSGTGVLGKSQEKKTSSAGRNFDGINLVDKFQSSEIVISYNDRKRFEMSTMKDRIYIPKKLWRKGATYKVDDYYYNDDGEFLYRVPGMIGKQE